MSPHTSSCPGTQEGEHYHESLLSLSLTYPSQAPALQPLGSELGEHQLLLPPQALLSFWLWWDVCNFLLLSSWARKQQRHGSHRVGSQVLNQKPASTRTRWVNCYLRNQISKHLWFQTLPATAPHFPPVHAGVRVQQWPCRVPRDAEPGLETRQGEQLSCTRCHRIPAGARGGSGQRGELSWECFLTQQRCVRSRRRCRC